jgi:CheY-like chemotaxis protein
MMNERNSESNCKLMISEAVDSLCSACTEEISNSYVCLVVEQDELHIERKHFLHLLESGFMTSSVGQENSLLRASILVHELGGHFSLTLKDPGLAVSLYLPEHLPERLGEPYVAELKLPGQGTGSGPAEPAAGKAASTGRNILIIDDEISVANYLKKIVNRAGYEATVFTDSAAALEHFKFHADQFDLVITDQTMPGPSGDAVMQLMLEQNPKLPIIVCTGYSQAIDSTAAYNAGAAGFVTKPVRVAHLMQTINRAIGPVQ